MSRLEENTAIVEAMLARIGLHPRQQRHKDAGLCIAMRDTGTRSQRGRLCRNPATCGDYCHHHDTRNAP